MIRFRNPGTEYKTQIQVIKELYKSLKDYESFTLEDMALVIARSRLMTAYGYAGDDAIQLSQTEQQALNSAVMNAKMYAEVFRMLGWVTPFLKNKSYPLVFTYIGVHMATSLDDNHRLYEQCVLGINNPTDFSGKMTYNENIRFFKTALRTFIDLNGIMYKHELCLGPMSISDLDNTEYLKMINYIKSIRGDYNNLRIEFSKLAKSLGMKETPVDNCTRLPIALMKSCGWIESVQNSTLYNKSMSCLKITQKGIDIYNEIKDYYDLRLDYFKSLTSDVREALIRMGTYSMLERAGYDVSHLKEMLDDDRKTCLHIIKSRKLLFSPCQTIYREEVEDALGFSMSGGVKSSTICKNKKSKSENRFTNKHSEQLVLNIPDNINFDSIEEKEELEFIELINSYVTRGFSAKEIIEELFYLNRTSTQKTFYPMVVTLFRIIGFDCIYSRTGDNGSRWDAIIVDSHRSIPIEIKSPTEEEHISIKAIRQSLENKIILLSRKTYITDKETTSLAVGYYMPNDRAEVSNLISDFKATFGYKIGVIDFKSLLTIAISLLINGKVFEREKMYYLEGLIYANIE